jgi:uncharacterized protein
VRVAVVGATGLVGRHLAAALTARGDEVVAISRGDATVGGGAAVRWDPARAPFPDAVREGTDAIVNLAGAPLTAGRWTAAQRDAILTSRLESTRGVAAAIGPRGPRTLLNASAVGVYGPTESAVDEHAPAGDDFLAGVCVAWEAAAGDADGRVVTARSGIVLANDGGALPRLARIARLGLLGTIGTGRQWVPWIHVADEVAALVWCLDRDDVVGAVNLVAPRAVRQADFARCVRQVVGRRLGPPAPAALVRAALGEASTLVLSGQRAVPAALDASGFAFGFPTLDGALADLLGAPPTA